MTLSIGIKTILYFEDRGVVSGGGCGSRVKVLGLWGKWSRVSRRLCR